jgi:CotH kinase protein/Lamin Tail Domain/Secretion system C-terminal sorting domain
MDLPPSVIEAYFNRNFVTFDFFKTYSLPNMKKQFLLSVYALLSLSTLVAQQLPDRFWITADGRRLVVGNKPSENFYDESSIKVVELTFAQTDWWTQLTNNYATKKPILASLTYDGKTYPNVGVRFRGNTSYRVYPNKKSYSVKLDFVDTTQDLKGYETLHFNNAADDPSMMREVLYNHLNRRHIPNAKANFIQLKINGDNFGPYPNIQVLNGDFMKEWFLNNDGTRWRAEGATGAGGGGGGGGFGAGSSTLNFLGTDPALYQNRYTLKKTGKSNPTSAWTDLVRATQALNTPVIDTLKKVFDYDRALWFVAHEIMFGDDDSYVNKGGQDYFVFWDSATARITPIEYDGNSAFNGNASAWSPFLKETNVQFPIMNKLFAVPELRQRYLAHVRTMLEESLLPSFYEPKIDAYYNLIDALVQNDPKKSITYAQFQAARGTIKTWLSNRRTTYMANAEVNRAYPDVQNVVHISNGQSLIAPAAGQQPTINAKVSFFAGVNTVYVYYATGLDGYFERIAMKDDGLSGDGAANDGVYGAKLPAYGNGTYVRYYIEAIGNDANKTAAYMPKGAEHDVYFYQVKLQQSQLTNIAINEIMADNKTTVTDPSGQYEDWIELFNKTNAAVDLGGFYLSDDVTNRKKFKIPTGTTIPANGYLIVWADEDGTQTGVHANFKLAASGETVILSDRDSAVIEQIIFGQQVQDRAYARRPNGTGNFVIQAHTFNKSNESATSTADILPENAVKLYPNPTSQGVNIEANSDKQLSLRIYNVLGQSVYNSPFLQKTFVSTEGWQKGVYFVKVGDVMKKLLVE